MSMRKASLLKFTITVLIASIVTTGCTSPNPQSQQLEPGEELHVAAASDLRFAFEEIGEVFQKETGITVVFQFGSSGNLAQQIANGAPFDIFASANEKFVQDLIDSGDIIEETKALYAMGRIVLAVNNNANLDVKSLEDLLSDDIDHISLANPNHAPYGLAGKEALQSLGLWDLVEDKLVYGENVSQAMQFIQTGNAPVGIIALSIANVEEIEYFLIDEALHNPLRQMLGVVSHAQNKEAAERFTASVNSPQGREIMEKYGFYLP